MPAETGKLVYAEDMAAADSIAAEAALVAKNLPRPVTHQRVPRFGHPRKKGKGENESFEARFASSNKNQTPSQK